MNRAVLIFPALILASVLVLLGIGHFVYAYPRNAFIFPLVVGFVVVALCAAEIAGTLTAQRLRLATVAEEKSTTQLSFSALGWTLALAVFLFGLGFVFGAAAYLLVCLRANGASWRVAVAASAASLLFTWGLFINIMNILLPIEPLWWPQ